MKLRAEEKRVDFARKLGDFHEFLVWRNTGENEAGIFELFNVLTIHLKAVAVAFGDGRRALGAACNRPLFQDARIRAESH